MNCFFPKVKPEYNQELMDQCDLIVMGGYYGSGRKGRGLISHFLLGVVKKVGAKVTEVHSFCRVGSGYSMKELYELLQKLEPHFRRRKNSGQNWETVGGLKLELGREKPDVVIAPEKSVLLQINAAEIILSDQYKTGCTLR